MIGRYFRILISDCLSLPNAVYLLVGTSARASTTAITYPLYNGRTGPRQFRSRSVALALQVSYYHGGNSGINTPSLAVAERRHVQSGLRHGLGGTLCACLGGACSDDVS